MMGDDSRTSPESAIPREPTRESKGYFRWIICALLFFATTVNYTMNPTTFLEGTYGFIRNELTGGNEGGVLVNDSANRLNGLAAFPLLYPNAG